MLICETFYSVQGEGCYTGYPSIFIRTSICQLRCQFCDSYFTSWYNEGNPIKPKELYDKIIKEYGFVSHVVITGGEPLINNDLQDLLLILKENNHFVTIETNGLIFRDFLIHPDIYSISPKFNNSIPTENLHVKGYDWKEARDIHVSNLLYNDSNITKYLKSGTNLQFKFVICDVDKDVKEVLSFINKFQIPKKYIFLMPEGVTREAITEKSIALVEICKELIVNFSTRLHINLWEQKRGV